MNPKTKISNARYRRATRPEPSKTGRNEPCPCGSGRKFKKCCAAPPPPAPKFSPALQSAMQVAFDDIQFADTVYVKPTETPHVPEGNYTPLEAGSLTPGGLVISGGEPCAGM